MNALSLAPNGRPFYTAGMQLRSYIDDDFDDLAAAWRAASVVAHPFLTPDFLNAEVESIREVYLPASETWVAVKEGHVVGFMALLGDELGALFVHPKFWGAGIGRGLLDKAIELRGSLTVDVFEANQIGRAFYTRYGFVATGQKVHEETGHPLIHMQLAATKDLKNKSTNLEKPNHEGT